MRVVNIAESEINLTGGMARVAWYWKSAFERQGHEFRHFGTQEIENLSHPRYFPKAALRYYLNQPEQADIVLVHEPASGVFVRKGIKTIVVSHGLERRGWQIQNGSHNPDLPRTSLKTRLLFPFWRLHGCDVGLRKAAGALLINQDDKKFAKSYYGIKDTNILVFNNGANLTSTWQLPSSESIRTILFIGTWHARKGIHTLARAAKMLYDRGVKLEWVLAGTGGSVEQVFKNWPECLHASTEVIPQFSEKNEAGLYERCNLFVLPSFFEGQPLALLQAMAYGRCCITTNICGQKDIIHHRVNGLLFDPGDALTLTALIEESSGNVALQIELGTNARNAVKHKDWCRAAAEVVDFVEKIQTRRE